MPMIQYNFKILDSDLELIQKVSELRGVHVTDFLRISYRKELARLGFLTDDECKALEVATN